MEYFDWSENPLDALFLSFVLTLKGLSGLELNLCEYGDDKRHHVLDALSTLMRAQPISRFEMRGTKKRPHTFLLRELLSVMTEQNTIVDLDVSELGRRRQPPVQQRLP
jgi:hypothetical protein